MPDWQRIVAHYANQAEEHFDALKYRLHERLGGAEKINIIAYNGYGRPDRLYIKGRVLEDRGELAARDHDSLWRNLINTYKRMDSNEIPHALVRVRFQRSEQVVTADEEGFFEAWVTPSDPIENSGVWQQVELELVSPQPHDQPLPVRARGKVLVPPPTARFVVISDIDDTVLQSDATHLVRMARNLFLGNARTRLPFPGVAAFYRALLDGPQGNDLNPLFYVSSSPWNLYDLLVDFFRLQHIPIGPVLFLRDWGLTDTEILPTRNRDYKLAVIRQLIEFYPGLPFLLIGDSGQEDPEIYQQVVQDYPNRVLAVYIRNVSQDLRRPQAIQTLAEKVVQAGSTLILADDTLALAKHALEKNWIAAQALPSIQSEKVKDESQPTPLEKLLAEPDTHMPTVSVQGDSQQSTTEAIQQGAISEALEQANPAHEHAPTVIVEPSQQEKEPKKPDKEP